MLTGLKHPEQLATNDTILSNEITRKQPHPASMCPYCGVQVGNSNMEKHIAKTHWRYQDQDITRQEAAELWHLHEFFLKSQDASPDAWLQSPEGRTYHRLYVMREKNFISSKNLADHLRKLRQEYREQKWGMGLYSWGDPMKQMVPMQDFSNLTKNDNKTSVAGPNKQGNPEPSLFASDCADVEPTSKTKNW